MREFSFPATNFPSLLKVVQAKVSASILLLYLVSRTVGSLTSDNSGNDDGDDKGGGSSHKIALINPQDPYESNTGISTWGYKPEPDKPLVFEFNNLNDKHKSNKRPGYSRDNFQDSDDSEIKTHRNQAIKVYHETDTVTESSITDVPSLDTTHNQKQQKAPFKAKGRSFNNAVGNQTSNETNNRSADAPLMHHEDNAGTLYENPEVKLSDIVKEYNMRLGIVPSTEHENTADHNQPDEYGNINDGDLSAFLPCNSKTCGLICSETKLAKCDKHNSKICLCPAFKFVPAETPGTIRLPNLQNDVSEIACDESCTARFAYARVLENLNGTKECICITNQTSSSGITFCDSAAKVDICKTICQSDAGECAFNGICLCRDNWSGFMNLSMPNVRHEIPSDHSECSKRCSLFHHDFIGRIHDSLTSQTDKPHKFQSKYCLCAPESSILTYKETHEIMAQGFQICSGLKCKKRCGMRDAVCEPQYRRACLCHRQNIFIGSHLWSRLPNHNEKFCQDSCFAHGLSARVIEKNPLFSPSSERFSPWYRWSMFSFVYDGKFCHCIKVELEMSQFRPCTDEICRWICGHDNGICDIESRRSCICNTHKLIAGLGRKPYPGEINCDTSCRHHLMDARLLDVTWDTNQLDGWGVTKSKFCGCIRETTEAGLTHCDGGNDDLCPKFCNNSEAFCTREKYCECGIDARRLLKNGTVRLPTGPENEECGETCRSWMWPLAEDLDRIPLIYDEGRLNCSKTNSCPRVESPRDSSAIGFRVEKIMNGGFEVKPPRKFCLCSKSTTVHYKPGTRILPQLVPYKAHGLECIGNHTCVAIGNAIHIK